MERGLKYDKALEIALGMESAYKDEGQLQGKQAPAEVNKVEINRRMRRK